MKKRLLVYLTACFLVGIAFATVRTLQASNHSTMISVSFYPESDADQVVSSINDLHLKNVMATKVIVDHGFTAFCLQTMVSTLTIAFATGLVLILYATLCRVFQITLKK